MITRQLCEDDASAFANLIVNMYAHLENLEWFTPMPYDIESVKNIISNPRFYIIGAFIDNNLVAVSSLDYKCGKLIGKVAFPKDCNTSKLVEIGFNIVHFNLRGKKLMQILIENLLNKLKLDEYEYVFTKVHKDNIASYKSCINKGFKLYCSYQKTVDKLEFENLSNQSFFNNLGKINAEKTLKKFKNNEKIFVEYNILMQKL